MRRFLFALLALAMLVSCTPKTVEVEKEVIREVEKEVVKEVEKPTISIKWFTELSDSSAYFVAQKYRSLTGVDVQVQLTMPPDGTTNDLDAMFAQGAPPNVYSAYGGRTNKYYNIAIPLKLEEDAFIPGMLDLCKNSKGEVVAVPHYYWVVGGSVNLSLVEKYQLNRANLPSGPDRTWTIAQFEALAAEFRSKAAADEYVTLLFGANGSGDYYPLMQESGLGAAPLYTDGKFDVSGMVGAWTKFKEWVAKGYMPAGVGGLSDEHYIQARNEGKLLVTGEGPQASHANFEWEFVSYPSLDGSFVPFAVAPTCHIAVDTEDAARDAAAKAFVEWLSEPEQLLVCGRDFSTRIDVELRPDVSKYTPETMAQANANIDWAYEMLERYGVMDMGIGNPRYQDIRTLRVTKLSEAVDGIKPVEQAVAEFQSEGEALLSK